MEDDCRFRGTLPGNYIHREKNLKIPRLKKLISSFKGTLMPI